MPVVAFSVGEEELRGVDTKPLVGHLAAWNYFHVDQEPRNDEFIKKWAPTPRAKNLAGHKDKPLTNDPMEATYIGINMWKQAVEKAKTTDVDKVIAAMAGQTFKAPERLHRQDGREEPPPAQAGVHRRGQGRRPVQRGVEDPPARSRPSPGALHRRQRQEADDARVCAATARHFSSGLAGWGGGARWRSPLGSPSCREPPPTGGRARFSRRSLTCLPARVLTGLARPRSPTPARPSPVGETAARIEALNKAVARGRRRRPCPSSRRWSTTR